MSRCNSVTTATTITATTVPRHENALPDEAISPNGSLASSLSLSNVSNDADDGVLSRRKPEEATEAEAKAEEEAEEAAEERDMYLYTQEYMTNR